MITSTGIFTWEKPAMMKKQYFANPGQQPAEAW